MQICPILPRLPLLSRASDPTRTPCAPNGPRNEFGESSNVKTYSIRNHTDRDDIIMNIYLGALKYGRIVSFWGYLREGVH